MQHILRILRSASELRWYYVAISFLSTLGSLATVLVPILSGWAIDEVRRGIDARVDYVVVLAVLLFVMDIASNALFNVNGYLGDQMAARLQAKLSSRYFEHLLKLPQRYFDTELSGKIISRLNRSITQITMFMQMSSNNFLQFVITTIFSLILVTYYSWPVAVMLFALYPIYIWMTVRSSSKWQDYQSKKNLHTDIASGRFAEAISQVRVVKSFLREKRELRFFGKHMDEVVATNKPQSRFWHVQDFRRRLALNLIFLGVYLYVFVSAARGQVTPGEAVALVLLAQQIRIPIFTISFLVENTQRAVADSRDYFEIMNLQPEIADIPGARNLRDVRGSVAFRDVHFGYDADFAVLRGVSFEIKPNTKVALVGESGEGKTTITSMLLRFYDIDKGEVLVDGHDIRQVTQQSLRQNIGVVFQEPALFSGTIRENIAYAKPSAKLPEIVAAARAANAHEFIEKFDNGYDTQIGERGLKLSGGQKQRIAIARALLKDAPILILDEATSSLDSKSEHMVQDALERLMKGRTTIIIAHRLSTIQYVDQIITIRNGKVDEVGSPAELAKTKGIYAQLLRLQRGQDAGSKKKLRKYDIAA